MSASTKRPPICGELCGVLSARRRQIEREYAVRLRGVGPHYATREPEELTETTERASGAYLAALCVDDWGPMDAFVQEIAERRFPLRFPLSEVQKAFALFREISHPILTEIFRDEALDAALSLLDGTVDRAINRFSDTYQALHLEEIRKTSAELADAHRRLRGQYEEVAEAARIKSQFFANMSHELRSPLNSVIGYTELLLDGVDGPVNEEQRRDLERILGGSHYLLKLINNILDMTKIEAGRMEVDARPFDPSALLAEAVDTVAPLAYRKQLRVETHCAEDMGPFVSDPDKVKQVLINLLSNAVKFTSSGEVVCEARPEAGRLRFEVRDTGVGIAAEDRQRIFSKFYQIDASHAREHRGTGLGLPLSRMLVELMGGRLEVESTPGQGSRFTFWIPEIPSGPEPAAATGTEGERPRVLVIEDDPSALELIRRVLETEGIETVPALDGAEGLDLAHRIAPSAITVDLLMPHVDGWEVLEKLKSDRETAGIPVVVVSCVDRQEKGKRLGADGYLVKPIDREELVGTVRRLIGGARRPEAG